MLTSYGPTRPIRATANGAVYTDPSPFLLGNFFCTAGGTVRVENPDGSPLLAPFPVSQGQSYNFNWAISGGTVFVAGGARGVFGVLSTN
jgi:hypothetical protein